LNWSQLKAIIWLRWRLSRNQFTRAGRLNAGLSVVLAGLLLTATFALTVGGFIGGVYSGPGLTSTTLLMIWDGAIFFFLIFWLMGLMVEIQRSESIDLTKLLHLPITLPQVFLFNYAASHAAPSMLLMPPAMIAFALGMAWSRGLRMALLVVLILSFLFLLTSWTYCLRGWLASLMTNKRRRRSIIVWITLAFIAVSQLPNVFLNSRLFRQTFASNSHKKNPALSASKPFIKAHLAFPPGWVGYSAMRLADGNPWPTLGATLACTLIGALGLSRAYGLTLRFHRGEEGGPAGQGISPPQPLEPARRLFLEKRVPGLPEEVGALSLATFRCLTRAPELKMALIMPIVLGSVFLSIQAGRPQMSTVALWASFAVTGAGALASFSISHTMANVFGLDRNGFRALILLPTRRHYILLAKNLAFFPFAAVVSASLIVLLIGFARLPWGLLIPGVLQAVAAFFLCCLGCNLLSILVPYRLSPNSLQAKKPKPLVVLAMFLSVLALPLVMCPILLPPALELLFGVANWGAWMPVNLLASIGLILLVGALYRLILPMQGRLLQHRERAILLEVTEETE
jgi:hypothetical protein